MTPPPSSITPIPLPESSPHAGRSTRALGVAGLLLGGLSWVGSLISAVGGLPDVVKVASQLLAQGWRPALGLVAVAAYLILVRLLAESRVERQAMQTGIVDLLTQIGRAVNQLISHAASEDHAHQRSTAADMQTTEMLRELKVEIRLLRDSVDKLTGVAADITQAKTDPAIRPAAGLRPVPR